MNKSFPYILGGIVLVLLVVIMTSNATKPLRKMDERITLRQADKIPYGLRAATKCYLPFSQMLAIYTDKEYPGRWDSIDVMEEQSGGGIGC